MVDEPLFPFHMEPIKVSVREAELAVAQLWGSLKKNIGISS